MKNCNWQYHIVHQPRWIKTELGNFIELYTYFPKNHTSQISATHPILLIGGVHGDEPEGVRLAEDLLEWLSSINPQSIRTPWIIIPCLNKDGFMQHARVNGRGIDLNRNFPSPDWSPHSKEPRYNPGPHPSSEIEVQALVQLIESHQPSLILHFHSWNPGIIYTGGQGKSYQIAENFSKLTGYPLQEDIGYPTPGSLGQFAWTVHKIPVICLEEQEKISLTEVWPHFGNALKKLFLDT